MRSFIQKYSKYITKLALLAAASGMFMVSLAFIVPIAGLAATIVCPSINQICSGRSGIMLFSIGALAVAIAGGALPLRYIAKVNWATALESTYLTLASVYLTAAIWDGLFKHDTPWYFVIIWVEVIVMVIVHPVSAFFVQKLQRWQHLIPTAIGTLMIAAPQLLLKLAE